LFDKARISLNDHFLIDQRTNSTQVNNASLTSNKKDSNLEDVNSSRYLQDRAGIENERTNNLILKENVDKKTVENTESKTIENTDNNDVPIHNNFIRKNANIEVDTNNPETANQYKPTPSIRIITMRDYESLTIEERFVYDNRPFFGYLKQNLIRTNLSFSLLYKESIIDPIHIRITKLVFSISLLFGTNAFFFSDYYIEQRITMDNQVIIFNL
jgi:hypothetical protein